MPQGGFNGNEWIFLLKAKHQVRSKDNCSNSCISGYQVYEVFSKHNIVMVIYVSTYKKFSIRTFDMKDFSLELIGTQNSLIVVSFLITYKSDSTNQIDEYLDKEYSEVLNQSSNFANSKNEVLVIGSGTASNQENLYKLVKLNEKIKKKLNETGMRVYGIAGIYSECKENNEKLKRKVESSSLEHYQDKTLYIYSNRIGKEYKTARIPIVNSNKQSNSSICEFSIYSSESVRTNRKERLNSNDCLNQGLSCACSIF